MELDEQDISLIDQYLAGELAGDDLAAFRKRMTDDPAFAAEVKLQADIVAALRADGRTKQKTQLAALQATMLAAGEIKPYTPSQGGGGGGGGSAGGSFMRWLIGLAITGAVGYGVWYFITHRNSEDGGNIMDIFQQHTPADTVIRRDTIRIESHSGGEGRPTQRKDGGGPGTATPGTSTTTNPGTPQDVTVITQTDTQFVDDKGNPIDRPSDFEAPGDKPTVVKGPTGKIKNDGGKVPQPD